MLDDSVELWKPVVGYEEVYEVSTWGRIRRLVASCRGHEAGRLLKPSIGTPPYCVVVLTLSGCQKHFRVHRIVMNTFVGPCPCGWEVNHIDGNKLNNYLSNLEYLPKSANIAHAAALGLTTKGERNPQAKLTDDNVRSIRRLRSTHSVAELATTYKVSESAVFAVLSGTSWRHLL